MDRTVVSADEPFAEGVSYRAFADRFYEFEHRTGLFDLEIRGETVWDYLRWAVFYEFINQRHDLTIQGLSRVRWQRRLRTTAALAATWIAPPRTRGRYDVVLVNYARTVRIDGRDVNKHMYDLATLLGQDYRVLLVDPDVTSVRPGLYPCDALALRGLHALASARGSCTRFSPSEREVLGHIGSAIGDHLGFSSNIDHAAQTYLAYQLELREAYRGLLEQMGAKLLIVCDDALKKGVFRAAAAVGCRTVDYQHSLMSRLNVAYNYADDVPGRLRSTLPDVVFTFGRYWHADFRLPVDLQCVGFPHFEREFSAHRDQRPDPRNVLIVSSIYERQDLIRTAEAISRALPDVTVYYKLRSEEYTTWRSNYPASMTTAANIVMIDRDSPPLYHYLATCQYQVGVNSTVLVEGLPFGATPVVLTTGWYEEMTRLCEDGYALRAASPAEAVAIVRERRQPPRRLAAECLFAADSRQAIRGAVAGLVAR